MSEVYDLFKRGTALLEAGDFNQATIPLQKAADGPLKGILACSYEELVSIDFNHHAASSTVDLKAIKVIEGKLVRVASWYDNEWGFSNRMCDTAAAMGAL